MLHHFKQVPPCNHTRTFVAHFLNKRYDDKGKIQIMMIVYLR